MVKFGIRRPSTREGIAARKSLSRRPDISTQAAIDRVFTTAEDGGTDFRSLHFSRRTVNALIADDIYSLDDLRRLTAHELNCIHGVGPKAIARIKEVLHMANGNEKTVKEDVRATRGGADAWRAHGSYTVYRSDKSTVSVNGAVNCQVQDGSLVFSDSSGVSVIIFGPNQWVTVNTPPMQATGPRAKRRATAVKRRRL